MPRGPSPFRVRIVRYVDRKTGERSSKGAKGAKKVREKSQTYYAKIAGRRVSLGTADLPQAWTELNRLLRRQREESLSIRDHRIDAASKTLADHVDAWLAGV